MLCGLHTLLVVQTTVGGWLVSYAQSTGEFSAFDANVLASVMWGIFTAARLAFASVVVCVHPGWILFMGKSIKRPATKFSCDSVPHAVRPLSLKHVV